MIRWITIYILWKMKQRNFNFFNDFLGITKNPGTIPGFLLKISRPFLRTASTQRE